MLPTLPLPAGVWAAPSTKHGPWTPDEDVLLKQIVETTERRVDGHVNWVAIAEKLPGRNRTQCSGRFQYLEENAPTTKHGPWTAEEDTTLRAAVASTAKRDDGRLDWVVISKKVQGRNRIQCRNRFHCVENTDTTEKSRWTVSHQMDAPY